MTRLCFCIAICFLVSSFHVSYAEDSRTWHSFDGAATVEATFIAYDAKSKSVELLTNSDKTLKIALSKLSKSDQRFVKRVARKNRQPKDSATNGTTQKSPKSANRRKTKVANARTGRLFGINWTLDIDKALKVAEGNASPSDDRPVMWLRVLGDLNGFM